MKNIAYIIILISILTSSCKDKFERDLDRVSGSWQLNKLIYLNPLGEIKEITDSETILIFTNTVDPQNKYGSRLGIQYSDVNSWNFKYSFSFSTGECDLMFKRTDQETMPIDAIGKVQVYNFIFIDKNTLEFSIDNEFDYSNNQVIKNVKYTFKRI